MLIFILKVSYNIYLTIRYTFVSIYFNKNSNSPYEPQDNQETKKSCGLLITRFAIGLFIRSSVMGIWEGLGGG